MNCTIGTLLVCFSTLAVVGCGTSEPRIVRPPTPAQVAEVVRNARIALPPSAEAVAYSELRGMDDALWLQVRMPVSELKAFLAASPFSDAEWEMNEPFRLSPFDRLIASPPSRYRGAQAELPNARDLNIVIDETDGESAVVYLMWHET